MGRSSKVVTQDVSAETPLPDESAPLRLGPLIFPTHDLLHISCQIYVHTHTIIDIYCRHTDTHTHTTYTYACTYTHKYSVSIYTYTDIRDIHHMHILCTQRHIQKHILYIYTQRHMHIHACTHTYISYIHTYKHTVTYLQIELRCKGNINVLRTLKNMCIDNWMDRYVDR